jgi:hypothetical protein
MNKINIFKNKSSKGVILGGLLLGSFAFSYVRAAGSYYDTGAAYGSMDDRIERLNESRVLHRAAGDDDFDKVYQLLEEFADPNYADDYGCTPLHYAHNPEIIGLLCEWWAEPNKQDKEGNTPLHSAVFAEELDLERIGALLKCNAKTNIVNQGGLTPLSFIEKVINDGGIQWFDAFEELDTEKRKIFMQAKQLLERYSRR